jgi:hypothetical protein
MKKLWILLVFSILFSCGTDSVNRDQKLKMASYGYDEAEVDVSSLEETIVTKSTGTVVQDQKIIKTANLRFETKDVTVTHQNIISLVKIHNGFVQNDNSGKNYNKEYIRMTIRVPSEKFEDILFGISEGVGYFDQKDISQKDVTEEFVDVKARLNAKRKLENRYLELLQQAKNVKEMLEIERELSKIREEIEAKEGRLNYLQDKVSLSTFYIEFYKTSEIKGVPISYGQKILNALKSGWNAVSAFFIGLVSIWPFIFIIGGVIYFIRRYIKRKRKKN